MKIACLVRWVESSSPAVLLTGTRTELIMLSLPIPIPIPLSLPLILTTRLLSTLSPLTNLTALSNLPRIAPLHSLPEVGLISVGVILVILVIGIRVGSVPATALFPPLLPSLLIVTLPSHFELHLVLPVLLRRILLLVELSSLLFVG